MRRSRLIVLLAALCTVLAALTPAQAARTPSKPTANTPYLGWSSWSLQSTKHPGVNTQDDYSWLTERHVLAQAQVMATKLRSHGYEYVNIDAGWWRKWDWNPEHDQYARPLTDTARFPDGMAATARKIHSMGLDVGIYLPVGLEKEACNGGNTPQQTWWVRNADRSYTVALFNLDTAPATVTANWSDFGFHGKAGVRDGWSHQQLGRHTDSYSVNLAPHSAKLLKVWR